MNLSDIFKFIIGFFLALILLAGASAAAALYFAAKLTALPERPVFPNDKPMAKTVSTKPKAIPVKSEATPAASETPSPSPKPLEAGAYRATVTQPIGLILRDSPTRDANRIGGIGYKERIVVLEETPDKQWQRVRSEQGDLAGWIKGGNTERIEEQ